jgi:long-chain acyl-CoA synthetase
MKLGELLKETVKRLPRKDALIFKGTKWSYRQLQSEIYKLANGLQANGMTTGSRLAVFLENRPEYLMSYFAGHSFGAPVVPINNFSKGDEIKYMLEDCQVHTLITSPALYNHEISKIEAKIPSVQNIVLVGDDEELAEADFSNSEKNIILASSLKDQPDTEPVATAEFSDEDLAVIIYTSGTTGHPKGAMLSHRNLFSNSESCTHVLEIQKSDKILLYLPMFHSFTELVCMLLPVHWGLPIVLIERIDRVEIRAAIKRYRPTIMAGVPSVYSALLGAKLNALQKLLNPIRIYVSGAAPLPVEILGKFEAKFNRPLLEGYGLSESSPVVSVNPVKGPRKPGSVGLPVKNVEVRIVDDDGKDVAIGFDGEIIVRGPNVMIGYYNQPEETAKALKDGWLYTGDIGHLDDDGYLYIVERKKDMLIYRGCNIYPREVEEVLYKHPAIMDAAVVGIPDAARGEIPKAFVVLEEGHSVTERELKKFCAEHLTRYKVPKLFSFETELPRTATGKVLKKDLRKRVLKEQLEELNKNN